MRTIWLMLLVADMYGCRDSADPVRAFIPGTYIRFSEHEYGHEYDTLQIQAPANRSTHYTIMRRWKYERLVDGMPIEPEYHVTRISAYYLPQQHVLHITRTGQLLSFDVGAGVLKMDTVNYKKL